MARGVICPHCKGSLAGDVEVNENVICPECSKPFIARDLYISAFEDSNPSISNFWGNYRQKILSGIVGLLALIVLITWINLDNVEYKAPVAPSYKAQLQQQKTEIYQQKIANSQNDRATRVAEKYIAEYNIAKGNGDKPRQCALAGLVATAYLNAQDQENYRLWHYYEEKDCK
jgi:hypothetical protein